MTGRSVEVWRGGKVVARSRNLRVIRAYTRFRVSRWHWQTRAIACVECVTLAKTLWIRWSDGATLKTSFADGGVLRDYVMRSRILQSAECVRMDGVYVKGSEELRRASKVRA